MAQRDKAYNPASPPPDVQRGRLMAASLRGITGLTAWAGADRRFAEAMGIPTLTLLWVEQQYPSRDWMFQYRVPSVPPEVEL